MLHGEVESTTHRFPRGSPHKQRHGPDLVVRVRHVPTIRRCWEERIARLGSLAVTNQILGADKDGESLQYKLNLGGM